MVRRLVPLLLLASALAAPSHAAPQSLMPGVTLEDAVQFTPHGPVVLHVITAPRPGGLYALVPVVARSTITAGTETLTQLEVEASAQATVAGIDGDSFGGADSHPRGIVLQGGVLQHTPDERRSSIGVDTVGGLHVDRIRFFGTWRGSGPRRPLNGVNATPRAGQVVLFTPAYGTRAPQVAGAVEATLEPLPSATADVDLTAPVVATGQNGGDAIPADGGVLMATGASAAFLKAEAPLGRQLTIRLILQPAWAGVLSAVGGGPLLVRNGRPVFRSYEDFTNDEVSARDPRSAVGQLADGRVILVAVDGGQPGFSVGLTRYELAQAMVRLGAVTASALDAGATVTAAFDGRLLNRPPAGERPVKEALLVEYAGVYAPPPSLPLVTGDPGAAQEALTYKLVRRSTVTAELVGPNGVVHPLEAAVVHDPGARPFTYADFDAEGTWHWRVFAADDQGRTSTADRTFRFDETLRALRVPRVARGRLDATFVLLRPARARLQIETKGGAVVAAPRAVTLTAGEHTVSWGGRVAGGTRAYGGVYVAHLVWSSDVGTSDERQSFLFGR